MADTKDFVVPSTEVEPNAVSALSEPVRVPIPSVMHPIAQQVGQGVIQQGDRVRAGNVESIKAAASQWSVANVYRWATANKYEPDDINFNERMAGIPFKLADDEEEFLREKRPNSNADFNARVQRILDERQSRQIAGDNPVLAGITSFADPAWLGISIGSLGIGTLANTARAGRALVAAGEIAGATTVGLIENEIRPTSAIDIVSNALIGGAASQLFFNGKRWAKLVDDYPEDALLNAAAKVDVPVQAVPTMKWVPALDDAGQPVLSASGKPKYVQVRAADDVVDVSAKRSTEVQRIVDEVADIPPTVREPLALPNGGTAKGYTVKDLLAYQAAQGADNFVTQMGQHLMDVAGPMMNDVEVVMLGKADTAAMGGRSFFDPKSNRVVIAAGDTPENILHEVAHAGSAAKVAYGKANPDSVHGKIVKELDVLRARVAKYIKDNPDKANADTVKYLNSSVDEFVAGLYTGPKSPLIQVLRQLPVGKGSTALTAGVALIRRLLGLGVKQENALTKAMGLSDELIGTPTGKLPTGVDGQALYAPPGYADKVVADMDSMSKKLADKLGWNLHKTMANWNKQVADFWLDDPRNMAGDSVSSQQRAIRNDLTRPQVTFENTLREAMADAGAGTWARTFRPRKAMRVQQELERDLAREMLQRQQYTRTGALRTQAAPPHIAKLADDLDAVYKTALEEMKQSGVKGADAISELPGHFTRRWSPQGIQDVMNKFEVYGLTPAQAKNKIVTMLSGAARRANGWDADLAKDVAGALVDRAIRKGNKTDTGFRAHVGNEAVAEVRDVLEAAGVPKDRLQRALDVITGVIDEAGKAPVLKHRIDLDLNSTMLMPDGTTVGIIDLIDTGMVRTTDKYLDTVAGQSAMARKGIHTPSDIAAQRTKLIESIESQKGRDEAALLFDDMLNYITGNPTGEVVPDMMRKMASVTQMVGLGSSGMWQVTEYATIMQKYGLGKTLGYMIKEMPGFKQMLNAAGSNIDEATDLKRMLSDASRNDVRLRPFVQRLEDNFEFHMADGTMAALENAKQWVPYANAMKFVHSSQAKVTANLIVDTIARAGRGSTKHMDFLKTYGLESHSMLRLSDDIAKHGTDTAKWSDGTWDAVRGPLSKMMDDAVLRARLGEIPAVAQFSALGKFLFTFRSFVLAAHNKVLTGTMHRHGFAGLSLLMLYQWPLSVMAVAADNTIKGRDELTQEELITRAVGQMGALGLITEAVGIAFGDKQEFGTPALIAADRVINFVGQVAQGNPEQAGAALLKSTPILAIIPPTQAIAETLK